MADQRQLRREEEVTSRSGEAFISPASSSKNYCNRTISCISTTRATQSGLKARISESFQGSEVDSSSGEKFFSRVVQVRSISSEGVALGSISPFPYLKMSIIEPKYSASVSF